MSWKICLGAGAFAMAAACAVSEPAVTPAPAGGGASLQTAPFSGPASTAGLAPAAAPQAAPQTSQDPVSQQDDVPDFTSVAANFDPSRQHFVYVLPPGLHGQPPWELVATVRHRGELKFETTLPLAAEIFPGGSRPEYPAGHEIVRLTGDGRWAEATAELDKVIQGLIAQYGRGDGSVEMQNQLKIKVDPAFEKDLCIDRKPAPIEFYLEEDGVSDLISLNSDALAIFYGLSIQQACEELAKPASSTPN